MGSKTEFIAFLAAVWSSGTGHPANVAVDAAVAILAESESRTFPRPSPADAASVEASKFKEA